MTARPGRRPDALAHWLVPAAIVFAGSMLLDTRTLMPGWASGTPASSRPSARCWASRIPPGYPSYVLLLWLASVLLQPFGDPALRANLLSAVLVSGASALVAVAVIQVTRRAAVGVVAGALLAVRADRVAERGARRSPRAPPVPGGAAAGAAARLGHRRARRASRAPAAGCSPRPSASASRWATTP